MSEDSFNEFVKSVKSNNRVDVETKFNPEFLNKPNNEGYYPIHLACINNAVDVFKYFLKQNCNIELLDSNGNPPIYHAINNGSVEIVKLLLGYRCSFDNGDSLLELAKTASKNRENTIKIVEKAIENRQIGIEMDLECSLDCDHKFCLTSFIMIEFKKVSEVGKGTFGKVDKVFDSKSKRMFAVKRIKWKQVETENLSTITKDAKYLENNINDYKTLLSHPHIIKYFGAIKDDEKLCIFMEYAENKSILDLIEIHYSKGLPSKKIIKYSHHILLALDYLHQNSILHRDIKCANILLNKSDNCKLTDLGFSRLLETISKHSKKPKKENKTKKQATTRCGTEYYMAPEIINNLPYSFPVDLWSLGATVIEMLTGKPPYHDLDENEVLLKTGRGEKYDYESSKPTTKQIKIFIDKLLSFDPESRQTAAELLKLDLFQNVVYN